MRVGPLEPRARAELDRRRASYARRCRFESCRAHDIPPPSGSGLALRRQGWAFESPRGDFILRDATGVADRLSSG